MQVWHFAITLARCSTRQVLHLRDQIAIFPMGNEPSSKFNPTGWEVHAEKEKIWTDSTNSAWSHCLRQA